MEFFEGLYKYCDQKDFLELRLLPGSERELPASLFYPAAENKKALAEALRQKENVYFGVGLRSQKSGKREDVSQIPAIWVDVDAKNFPSKAAAAKALWDLAPGWTYIIDTGGGYHGYKLLSEPVTREEFKRVEAINRGLAKKIGADMQVWDAPRILRVPGTVNSKYTPVRQVVLKHADLNFEVGSLDELEEYELLGLQVPSSIITKPLGAEIQTIVDRCEFIQHCIRDAKDLSEWEWYAMISNLAGFRGCVSAINDFSSPYKKYSIEETNRKILHAMDGSRPITCQSIKEKGFDCKRNCGVKSPAALPWNKVQTFGGNTNYAKTVEGEKQRLVAGAIPEKGFIRDYISYASEQTDAPRIFHLFCGLTLLSSAVGRNAWISGFGGRALYPNLWTVLIADSTDNRKGTSINMAKDLMVLNNQVLLPEQFSQEMLIDVLTKEPQGTFIWEEFGNTVDNLAKEYMMGTKDLLANLYDCPDHYSRALKSGTLVVKDPYITVLGSTNVGWLVNKDVRRDLAGGFLARVLWIPTTAKEKEMILPRDPDVIQRQKLKNFLGQTLMNKIGKFSLADITEQSTTLRDELREVAEASEYTVELTAAFGRYQAVAQKLAVLYAISEGTDKPEVQPHHFELACNAVKLLRYSVEELLRNVPKNKDDEIVIEVTRAMMTIHKKGHRPTMRDICRITHRKVKQLEEAMFTLETMGRIKVTTEGRQKFYTLVG